MSWLDRRILNKDTSLIKPSEEQKALREVKEDTTTLEDVVKAGTANVVPMNNDKFVCPKCNEGWTFARMKTIVCCGITYVRD